MWFKPPNNTLLCVKLISNLYQISILAKVLSIYFRFITDNAPAVLAL